MNKGMIGDKAKFRLTVLKEVDNIGCVKSVCDKYGITRKTYYNWKRRYELEGLRGLEDKSRAPKHPRSRKTPRWKVDKVTECVRNLPGLTLRKYEEITGIPRSTIYNILKANNMTNFLSRSLGPRSSTGRAGDL